MKPVTLAPRSTAIDRLRACFSSGFPAQSPVEEGVPSGPLTPAAVLFPIVLRDPEPTVLLTRRTDHLHHHPGQVSFPGGRVEEQDTSPIDTALRETEEEISLHRRHIELLGCLPLYRTGTGFEVTPVIGLVTPPFELVPDSFEVAEVFEVPLAFLLDPANHQTHTIEVRGQLRQYYAMPYGDHFIWGATAGMIVSLQRFVSR
ncbi:MAG: CoA pyrophosphatase [Zoogloea oleivorans]|jgi:8-oxo-dGTP pyrophosphatase MutT (NUDIX family)|uniref:CoA pyrophosphatase n=2 Tax=Zoogloea oleivorans TaxID=1552750 RepID=A0A6C2CZ00_9RHOO|nr:CoA pyrophosphatase [Zoogloea oleivorans]MBT9497007.1 CoA pyrophosphatase [Zoogloea sp.]MDY0034805.1 CoA pyrophosphatase [Zoogloea oleivorans]TYC58763.1 CoA pyrophosphatase [Zoogloea oleivorans]